MKLRALALAAALPCAAGIALAGGSPLSAAYSEAFEGSARANATGLEFGGSPDVLVVPLPPAAWTGLGSLALIVGMGLVRRRRHAAA